MKKSNQKGFMLTETLIVSTFIVSVLLFIYVQLRNINANYADSLAYNDVTTIYSAGNIKNFLLEDNYEELKQYFKDNFSLDPDAPLVYLDLTTCPASVVSETTYCQALLEQLNIKKVIFTDESDEYLLRFLDADNNLSNSMKQFIKSQKADGEIGQYRLYVETNDGKFATVKMKLPGTSEYVDNSGANKPELLNNMVPVKYDGSKWLVADTNSEWYDYDKKEWANAVILKENVEVGKEVTEENVDLWLVWIPRYKYQLFNPNNGSVNEQEIKIAFESETDTTGTVKCVDNIRGNGDSSETCTNANVGNWYTHPAFTFGDKELKGIWVGKFEVSGTLDKITTIPNVSSLKDKTVSAFFNAILNVKNIYGTNGDSHMMKNMEWGAVTYLSHSKYGTCNDTVCKEVAINPSNNFYTGGGINDAYKVNINQSTTGNIYGIYDMSGGTWEYMMANMVDSGGNFYNSSAGFSGAPNSKYYDSYTYNTSNLVYSRGKLGDATKETLKVYNSNSGGWYNDNTSFPRSNISWFNRGGDWYNGTGAGLFLFNDGEGINSPSNTTRLVIVN